MTQVLLPVLAVAFLAAGAVAVAVIVRKMMRGPALNTLFKQKPAKRIDVVEQIVVDAKRKLLLVRRDDVEHLVMTGGPVDIVIETGIGAANAEARAQVPAQRRTPPPLGLVAE